MTSYQLFETIGDIDDELIEEVSNSSYKKQNKIYTVAVLAACAMLVICLFSYQEKIHKNNKGNQVNEIVYHTTTETLQGKGREKDSVDNVVINKIESSYSNAKFGGKLKEVSERQWQKQYGTENFLEAHKKKYKLSFSNSNKVLYGYVLLQLSKNQVVEITADDEKMLDSSFKELIKTVIGNYEVAICKINHGNYCAIVKGNNAVYTIEGGDIMTENQFVLLLKKIFE